jgi:hypothetical protein
MPSQGSLEPLSKDEGNKLANLAIEAKKKAYCKSSKNPDDSMLWSSFEVVVGDENNGGEATVHADIDRNAKKYLVPLLTNYRRSLLEFQGWSRNPTLDRRIPYRLQCRSRQYPSRHLCRTLCHRSCRGINEQTRNASHPRNCR